MNKFKFFLFFLWGFIGLLSCTNNNTSHQGLQNTSASDLEKEKLEISQILDKLTTATERGNIDQIKEIWLESENDLSIGTESNEKLEGWNEIRDALKKQFRTFHETLISITDQSIWISEDGKIAWFYEELNYNFVFEDQAMEFKGIRVTGVLKKTEGKWRMVNQHLSVPAKLNMVKSR